MKLDFDNFAQKYSKTTFSALNLGEYIFMTFIRMNINSKDLFYTVLSHIRVRCPLF